MSDSDVVFEYACPGCGLMKEAGEDDDAPRCYGCDERMMAVGRTSE